MLSPANDVRSTRPSRADTQYHCIKVLAFLPILPAPTHSQLPKSAVHKALSSSPASVVVVHFVAGSKTGICSPSERVLTEMQERYGERLLVSFEGHCRGGLWIFVFTLVELLVKQHCTCDIVAKLLPDLGLDPGNTEVLHAPAVVSAYLYVVPRYMFVWQQSRPRCSLRCCCYVFCCL